MDDTLLTWLLAPPAAVGLFFLARWGWIRWLDARLDRAVDEAGVEIAKLGPFAGVSAAEIGAVGAYSVYEAIRTLVMVDDRVLDAIDFSRGGISVGFQRVQDHLATRVAGVGEAGPALKDNLLGFYADQAAAAHLAAEGHVVEFAHGTAPGAELLVNGHPYHVEIGLDPTVVKQHLAQFPDVTVVINQELAPHFDGVAGVLVDPALSHADAADHVQKTVERVGEIGKLDLHFPFITFTIALFAYAPLVFKRRLSVRDAARFTALDTGLVGGGAMALGKAGSLVGLGLGPVGAAAGGILGALAGGLGGAAGASWLKGRGYRGAVESFRQELEEFGAGLPDALIEKRRAADRKQRRVERALPALVGRPGLALADDERPDLPPPGGGLRRALRADRGTARPRAGAARGRRADRRFSGGVRSRGGALRAGAGAGGRDLDAGGRAAGAGDGPRRRRGQCRGGQDRGRARGEAARRRGGHLADPAGVRAAEGVARGLTARDTGRRPAPPPPTVPVR